MLSVFVLVSALWQAVTHSSKFLHFRAEDIGLQWTFSAIAVEEPSGIVYHPTRETLFVVSDEGYLAELTTDLEPISRYDIAADLEGVALRCEGGAPRAFPIKKQGFGCFTKKDCNFEMPSW